MWKSICKFFKIRRRIVCDTQYGKHMTFYFIEWRYWFTGWIYSLDGVYKSVEEAEASLLPKESTKKVVKYLE